MLGMVIQKTFREEMILPPWKKELLLRGSALAKAVDPKGIAIQELLMSKSRPEECRVGLKEGVGLLLLQGTRPTREDPSTTICPFLDDGGATKKKRRHLVETQEEEEEEEGEEEGGRVLGGRRGVKCSSSSSSSVSACEVSQSPCASSSTRKEKKKNKSQLGVCSPCTTNPSQSVSPASKSWGPDQRGGSSSAHPNNTIRTINTQAQPVLLHSSSASTPPLPSGMILASPAVILTDQEESLLLMDKGRLPPKASSSSLDSDDGSYSSTSSTEELQYGPGFVSRLKSRYMRSASLQSSNLRRTASLEDFLEDKVKGEGPSQPWAHNANQRNHRSQIKATPHTSHPRNPTTNQSTTSAQIQHSSRRQRDSMKRCKSVEVLSRNRLPSQSSSEVPPPLPPKTRTPLDLNASPNLRPEKTTLRDLKPRELPSTDIVKQTRKLFESIPSSPNVLVSSHPRHRPRRMPPLTAKSPPLDLPPKQIGIIRPMRQSRPEKPPPPPTEVKGQQFPSDKNKLNSEKAVNHRNNISSNKSSSAASKGTPGLISRGECNPKKTNTKSCPSNSNSTSNHNNKVHINNNNSMNEFQSIVLKEVKKEACPGGVKGVTSSPPPPLLKRSPPPLREEKDNMPPPVLPNTPKPHHTTTTNNSSTNTPNTTPTLTNNNNNNPTTPSSKVVVESKNITSFRDSWKARHEGKNTLVFNFINSKKDVSHIENDGLDFSKRKKKTKSSGVILLDSVIPNESTDDDVGRDEYDGLEDEEDISEEELKRPPSPCSIVFIGGNLISGKSSLRCSSINSDKKQMSISFSSSLEEVFEYPSFESSLIDEEPSKSPNGGLGSYTPSKNQLSGTPFQLGVSRSPTSSSKDSYLKSSPKDEEDPQVLRPVEDAVSWSGSSSSSDILF